ncbi:MAG: tetratricopeptide repeat protein [Planctomycetia bacterium]|nr:tetratricopeptide repeat protein [Planctomycetia bacterium]
MIRVCRTSVLVGLLLVGFASAAPVEAYAAKGYEKLDEMAVDRWAKLRETERYQLNIAEKYYREQNWAVAAGEYEKFVTLYETSEGCSYAQMKWANCQVKIKKLNTAVKDGYQTVIDYWPESADAVACSYLIGRTYKEMGEIQQAKAAYLKLLDKHNGEMVAILARLDLADLARIEQDRGRQIALLKELVHSAPRVGDAGRQIGEISRTLAILLFEDGLFADGVASMGTTWKEPELSYYLWLYVREPLGRLIAVPETKDRGIKVADDAIAYFIQQQPQAPKDDAERARAKSMAYYAADMHQYAGRQAEAGMMYDKLLAQYGNDDEVLARYAAYLKTQNRRDDARKAYGRMKNQIEGQHQVAYSYREESKPLLAVPIYQDLLTKDAANAPRWQYSLAEVYRDGGKYKEAIASFQQCDNFPTNLQQIGGCYRALNQFREAIGIYTQIVGGYEASASWALLQIGYTQEQAGQAETAIKTFQQVCKRYPKTGEASQAHQHLNNKYKIMVTLGGAKEE